MQILVCNRNNRDIQAGNIHLISGDTCHLATASDEKKEMHLKIIVNK
jgi:hypothetical protein